MTLSDFTRSIAKRLRAFRNQNRAQRFLLGVIVVLLLLLLIPSARSLGWLMARAWQTGQSLRLSLQAGFDRDELVTELQICREDRSRLLTAELNQILAEWSEQGIAAIDRYRALHPEQTIVSADIIARSVGKEQSIIRLNVGAEKGVGVGDTIASVDGVLLGVINSVTDSSSLGELFFGSDVNVPIMTLSGGKTLGLARGTGGAIMNLDYLPKNSNLQVGELVVTSGIDGVIPMNLLVGEVTAIDADDSSPFYKAQITLPFNPLTLSQVMIIKAN